MNIARRKYGHPSAELLNGAYNRHYQSLARELVLNCITRATLDASVRQPGASEDIATVELDYQPGSTDSGSYDNVNIIIPREGDLYPWKGELQARIEFGQFLPDLPAGSQQMPTLEYVERYDIFLPREQYFVEKSNYLFDFTNLYDPVEYFGNNRKVEIDEIRALSRVISRSPNRSVGF